MRALLLSLLLAAAPQFAPVLPATPLSFPADFGAHPAFKTEWWYVTGWLHGADGKDRGFQLTFFRSASGHERTNPSAFAPQQIIIGHAALADPSQGGLLHVQRSARAGMGLAWAQEGNTDVGFQRWRLQRQGDGSYAADVATPELTFSLRLAPRQAPLLQGDGGFSKKGPKPENASYYYSEPQLKVSGSMQGQTVSGDAWLDHEWSSSALDPEAMGWDWTGLNLADGSALMAFQIRSKAGATLWAHAALRDAGGKVTQFGPDQVSFTPTQHWQSPHTQAAYPVGTTIRTGASTWTLTPLMPDQELDARRSTGAVYWEGAVRVQRDGQPAGHGYLEMTGYHRQMQL